jgi:hypothetical protein
MTTRHRTHERDFRNDPNQDRMTKVNVPSAQRSMLRRPLGAAIAVLATSLLGVSYASASPTAEPIAKAPAPPAGWEVPPPVEVKKKPTGKKPELPACCGFDATCCTRQTIIDQLPPRRATRTFEVRFSDVPEAVVKEAPKDGPPVEGVPEVRVVDGTGAPFPWKDGPKAFEIRIIPPGQLGNITFNDGYAGVTYEKPEYRSLGYGTTLPIKETPDKGRSLLNGPLEYWIYNPGAKNTIVHDYVKGKLQGSPNVLAEKWLHVEAGNFAEGVVHGYHTMYDGKPTMFFILPEVLVGFESKDAKTIGGTESGRFASDYPYTIYRFPFGPGRSNMSTCVLREYEVRRWFDRPKDAMKLPEEQPIVISMSQTSVESEPRVRVFFF